MFFLLAKVTEAVIEIVPAHAAVEAEDERLVLRVAVVRVHVDLVEGRVRTDVGGVAAPVHVADDDLVRRP